MHQSQGLFTRAAVDSRHLIMLSRQRNGVFCLLRRHLFGLLQLGGMQG